jgi:AraC-like DNA-binding protein
METLAVEEGLVRWIDTLRSSADDRARRPQRRHRAVERAREHIAADPGRGDTLADIARAANCSAFHLARCFRQQTGQSLHGFRTQLRMTAALDRLRQGEQDLSALAADLGYASHSHFTGVFRRNFGRAPSQVRTNLAAPART